MTSNLDTSNVLLHWSRSQNGYAKKGGGRATRREHCFLNYSVAGPLVLWGALPIIITSIRLRIDFVQTFRVRYMASLGFAQNWLRVRFQWTTQWTTQSLTESTTRSNSHSIIQLTTQSTSQSVKDAPSMCMHVRVCVCVCVCVCACFVCMCVCMHACMLEHAHLRCCVLLQADDCMRMRTLIECGSAFTQFVWCWIWCCCFFVDYIAFIFQET